jgi:uncharacterized protein YeaO (DUF488 family)
VDGAPWIGVQLASDHVPPEWPDGAIKQQVHLDLWVADFAESLEQVIALGASVLWAETRRDDLQVHADQSGILLPVLAGRRAAEVI